LTSPLYSTAVAMSRISLYLPPSGTSFSDLSIFQNKKRPPTFGGRKRAKPRKDHLGTSLCTIGASD
jgi:hypothetical protein